MSLSGVTSQCRYKNIRKPSWQPPAFLFGPVWSLLYILMGVGAWQVWKHGGWAAQKDVLSLWVFQLIFNLFWNPIFFLKHDMSLALFDIGGRQYVLLCLLTLYDAHSLSSFILKKAT